MIYYLTSERHAGVMQGFLLNAGRALAARITVVTYERLLAEKHLRMPYGTYIFTNFNQPFGSRNPPSPARQWVTRLHDELVLHLGPERVLNDPSKSLGRFELLRQLHASGFNRFKAYQAGVQDSTMRFPVFLRLEHGTVRDAPPLLPSREAYEVEARRIAKPGMIAIEFCDTADAAGIYRKYGCFVVGERIVPRHLFKSRNWLVKTADIVDQETVREELDYLKANPHVEVLRRVFRLANISYGRIDYALLDGIPQIWEINTPPQIIVPPGEDRPERAPVHEKFVMAFSAALDAIDPQGA